MQMHVHADPSLKPGSIATTRHPIVGQGEIMTQTIRMQRGQFTLQWRPCVIATWKPQPMSREQRQPQVLDVTGVPAGMTPVDVMRRMEQTLWAPSTVELTQIDFSQIGLGRAVVGKSVPSPEIQRATE